MKALDSSGILVVGSANFDFSLCMERLPLPGETMLGGTFTQSIGGKGVNQATAAARAGARVSFLGAVGEDVQGEQIRQHLAGEGIDTLWARSSERSSTGVAFIMVDSAGRNCIAVAPGANATLGVAALEAVDFTCYSHVLLSLEIPFGTVLAVARRARLANCTVLLNPAPAMNITDELLQQVDILIPNEHEVAALTQSAVGSVAHIDAAASRFFSLGGSALIVTLGEQGAMIVEPRGRELIAGLRVNAVDTVGAGDCFCGVFTASVAAGFCNADAVRKAHVAAALSVQQHGAVSSYPSASALTEAFAKYECLTSA